MTMMSPSSYPGEPYLSQAIPNYERERLITIIQLVLAVIFWVFILPVLLSKEIEVEKKKKVDDRHHDHHQEAKNGTTTKTNGVGKNIQSRKRGKQRKATTTTTETTTTTTNVDEDKKKNHDVGEKVVELPPLMSSISVLGLMVTVVCVMLKTSPDNYYPTRKVFEAPLFTRDECEYLIKIAEQAAERNYDVAKSIEIEIEISSDASSREKMMNDTMKGFLKEPIGWQKKRHSSYPTTDLNIVSDPFTREDRVWLKRKLDGRLSPTISRLFGIPQNSIRAEDIFVVRYDGNRQASLPRHTDSGDITFSTLLSDGFQGGGTKYWDRSIKEPFKYVLPDIGQMTLFPASIQHEGVQVIEGRRYLLIGFLAVDSIDPFTHESTGLSWFSSWGSLNWSSNKFKSGYESAVRNLGKHIYNWKNNKHTRGLFLYMLELLYNIADHTYDHLFLNIVQTNKTNAFLYALDEAYDLKVNNNNNNNNNNNEKDHHHHHQQQQVREEASWFKGQYLNIDIDGRVDSIQSNRRNNENLFQDDKI